MTLVAHRSNGRRPASIPRALLDDVFGFSSAPTPHSDIEIRNSEKGFTVEIPVAGFKPAEIQVMLADNVLTVTAENERRKLARSLVVPEHIDTENIDVENALGMLTLTLPVHPKSQPRQFTVREKT